MKFTSDDLIKLRGALSVCRIAGIDTAVISEGMIRGLSENHSAAIITTLDLSIDKTIDMGIGKIGDLEKRLALFDDVVLVEGELNAQGKVRKLLIRDKKAKVEFRCTDSAIIKYPKSNNDLEKAVLTFTKPEISLIVKGVKTIGAEQITLQIKRDGTVHIEAADISNDRFETDLEHLAESIDEDGIATVVNYDTTSSGVLLTILNTVIRDCDVVKLVLMQSGQLRIRLFGHDVLAIPRIN